MPAWAVAVTAAVSAIVTYLVAWRKSSGRIATTEAAVLWDMFEKHVERQDKRIAALEADNAQLRSENDTLRRRIDRVENGGT